MLDNLSADNDVKMPQPMGRGCVIDAEVGKGDVLVGCPGVLNALFTGITAFHLDSCITNHAAKAAIAAAQIENSCGLQCV